MRSVCLEIFLEKRVGKLMDMQGPARPGQAQTHEIYMELSCDQEC